MPPRAYGLNCTLTPAPEQSSTQKMLDQVLAAIASHGFETSPDRLVDLDKTPDKAAETIRTATPRWTLCGREQDIPW